MGFCRRRAGPPVTQLSRKVSTMRLSIALGATLWVAAIASKATAAFIVPDFRGSPNSTYQEWDVFTSALNGPNTPDVANINTNGSAQLFQRIPGAFLTGGGNIYSFSTPVRFDVTVPDFDLGTSFFTTAVLQIRTLGTLLDLDSVTFNGIAPDSSQLLSSTPLGGFGGVLEDRLFRWNNVSGNVGLNEFAFASAQSSLSLDRLSIDTVAHPIPEPSSLALLALGAIPACGLLRHRLAKQ
jgi:hypothetical protein